MRLDIVSALISTALPTVMASASGKFVYPDPCDLICKNFPDHCGTGGSRCVNNGACQNLFWFDRMSWVKPFCPASDPSCNHSERVSCTEAVIWLLSVEPARLTNLPRMGGRDIHSVLIEMLEGSPSSRQAERKKTKKASSKSHGAPDSKRGVSEMSFDDQMRLAVEESMREPVQSNEEVKDVGVSAPAISQGANPALLSFEEQYQLVMANSVDPSKQGQEYVVDRRPGRRGFHNLGNTCYFNALMQVLGHSTVLRAAIKNHQPRIRDGTALHEFIDIIFSQMHSQTEFDPIDTTEIFQRLQNEYPGRYNPGIREDSIILLQQMLEPLEQYSPVIAHMFDVPQDLLSTCSKCRRETSTAESVEKVIIVPVPIPEDKTSMVTLSECFETLTTPYDRDAEERIVCPQCHKHADMVLQWHLGRGSVGPQLLMIQLARQHKDTIPVLYPEHLDLSELANSHLTGQYRLIGVIHLRSGVHYIADFWDSVRREWVHANDRAVETIEDFQLVSNMVYALLYERRS